jgi:hypothetical protein
LWRHENERREATKRKLEFEEGPKALVKFNRTMTALFRVPKAEIQAPATSSGQKTKKAGS